MSLALGDRTILDSLIPLIQNKDGDYVKAGSTKFMSSSRGRAAYVPQDTLRGIPDPGSAAIYIIAEAIKNNTY